MHYREPAGPQILKQDAFGIPSWIGLKKFSGYVANEKIASSKGIQMIAHAGVTKSGRHRTLEVPTIVQIKGNVNGYYPPVAPLTRWALAMRDQHTCAYCGKTCAGDDVTMDHIIPQARGGRRIWTNALLACRRCNNRKGCRTPEEAGMDYLFVPYVPSPFESMILTNRNILADQMDFIKKSLPTDSRLLS